MAIKITKTRAGMALAALAVVTGSLGFVSMAGATSGYGHIYNPPSHHIPVSTSSQSVKQHNNNDIQVSGYTHQYASTGDAGVYHNGSAGGASTGSSTNSSASSVTASVTNGGASTSAATFSTPTPVQHSKSEVVTTNNNDVHIMTKTDQAAKSGDATVANNGSGGSASTGNASNSSTSTVSVSVSN